MGGGEDLVGEARRIDRKPACAHRLGARVGGNVDDHRRIAQRPRGEEELFELALRAPRRRPDLETVGEDLCADAAGPVVDGESVPDRVEGPRHGRIVEELERLNRGDLVVINDGELAERLVAVGVHRSRIVGAGREAARIGTGDHGGQIAVHDRIALRHPQDGQSGARVPGRVDRLVVDDRVPIRRRTRGGELQIGVRDLAAVPLRPGRLEDDGAEEPRGQRASISLAAGVGRRAVQHVPALALRIERVLGRAPRGDQAARIRSDVRSIGSDAGHQLHPDHVHAGGARGRLLVESGLTRRRIRREQVLEIDLQAVADVHAQHHRTRPLVGAELHLARRQRRSGDVEQLTVDVERVARDRNDVPPEREDHPLRLDRPEPVPEERLVQRDDVRRDRVRALRASRARRQERQADQTQRNPARLPMSTAMMPVTAVGGLPEVPSRVGHCPLSRGRGWNGQSRGRRVFLALRKARATQARPRQDGRASSEIFVVLAVFPRSVVRFSDARSGSPATRSRRSILLRRTGCAAP